MEHDDRIVTWAERGEHITLTCVNHPDLRWSTKNIGYIGARSIFYSTWRTEECPCPARDLRPVCPITAQFPNHLPAKLVGCTCA
jgi:hypothetical protein